MAVDPEPIVITEEFTLTTGETVMVRREQYDFPGDPCAHVYYVVKLQVNEYLANITQYSTVQNLKDT